MADLAGLDIGERPDDTVVDRGQVDGGKRAQKTAFRRRAVDVGIMGRDGILDEKVLRGLRVVGVVMDQGLDQVAVFDVEAFILGQDDLLALEMNRLPFFFSSSPRMSVL